MKEDHDGAEPSASSVAAANLLRFSALAAPEEAGRLRQRASDTAAAFKDRLEQAPHALTQMCCSLSLLTAGRRPTTRIRLNSDKGPSLPRYCLRGVDRHGLAWYQKGFSIQNCMSVSLLGQIGGVVKMPKLTLWGWAA